MPYACFYSCAYTARVSNKLNETTAPISMLISRTYRKAT